MNAVTKLPPPPNDTGTLMTMIERFASDPAFSPERLMQMLELKERWDATEARKAFTVAMAAFKASPPRIVKNKHVRFQTQKGVTEYDHATHSEVTEKIAAGLGQHGLSHRWNVEQSEGRIRVTCIITHSMGHCEQVALTATADDSGNKNSIQAIGSAITYLQRYTLLAATGLTTADMDKADDDGRGIKDKPESDTIDESQIAALNKLIAEVGANRDAFMRYFKIRDLADIKKASYEVVVNMLNAKRKKS